MYSGTTLVAYGIMKPARMTRYRSLFPRNRTWERANAHIMANRRTNATMASVVTTLLKYQRTIGEFLMMKANSSSVIGVGKK